MNASTTYSPAGNSTGIVLSTPEPWALSERERLGSGLALDVSFVLSGYAAAPSFFGAIGGSLFREGPTSITLSGGTPCQKENQHQCHKRFQLPNFPTPTTTI